MISKIKAVNIVHNVISEHLHGEWNEEEQAEVFSAWDWELLAINKEICKRIRDEVEDEQSEPRSCDRNICFRNEYNGIECDECEVTKHNERIKKCDECWIAQNYNLEDDDSPCLNCGVEW